MPQAAPVGGQTTELLKEQPVLIESSGYRPRRNYGGDLVSPSQLSPLPEDLMHHSGFSDLERRPENLIQYSFAGISLK